MLMVLRHFKHANSKVNLLFMSNGAACRTVLFMKFMC